MPVCGDCGESKVWERFSEYDSRESNFCMSCFSLRNNKFNTYARLDESLADLGFADYAAYLASPLWAAIRKKVLSGSAGLCGGCGAEKPTQVHHRNYSLPVMKGERNEKLVPVCRGCHQKIEFKGERKLSLNEANSRLDRMRKDANRAVRVSPPGATKKARKRAKNRRKKVRKRDRRAVIGELVAVMDAMREHALWHHLPTELVERAEVAIELAKTHPTPGDQS